jgi:hypothetical protein
MGEILGDRRICAKIIPSTGVCWCLLQSASRLVREGAVGMLAAPSLRSPGNFPVGCGSHANFEGDHRIMTCGSLLTAGRR